MNKTLGGFVLVLPLTMAGAGSALAADAEATTCSKSTLQGTYLFADYCDGKINGLVRKDDGTISVTDLRLTAGGLTSFGEDADGELYVLSAQNGVQRLEATTPPPR